MWRSIQIEDDNHILRKKKIPFQIWAKSQICHIQNVSTINTFNLYASFFEIRPKSERYFFFTVHWKFQTYQKYPFFCMKLIKKQTKRVQNVLSLPSNAPGLIMGGFGGLRWRQCAFYLNLEGFWHLSCFKLRSSTNTQHVAKFILVSSLDLILLYIRKEKKCINKL